MPDATFAILTRGYRSKPQPFHQWLANKILFREDATPPRIVSDGNSLLLDSEMAGDEPYMLASNLKDVVVLVDKNRVEEWPLRHREIWLRHPPARRWLPVLENYAAGGTTWC